jgi:hypothetical protein
VGIDSHKISNEQLSVFGIPAGTFGALESFVVKVSNGQVSCARIRSFTNKTTVVVNGKKKSPFKKDALMTQTNAIVVFNDKAEVVDIAMEAENRLACPGLSKRQY